MCLFPSPFISPDCVLALCHCLDSVIPPPVPCFHSRGLPEERTGRAKHQVCELLTEPQTEFRSLIMSKWSGIPLAKRAFFPSLHWSSRERQCAILLAAPCMLELKAQPCWCAVHVSTTSLLLSGCFGKILFGKNLCVAHTNAMLKKPAMITKLKAC